MNLGLIITYVVITIYCLSLLLIFFYSLTILNLSVNYLKNKHQNNEAPKFNLLDPNEIPYVTVQPSWSILRTSWRYKCWMTLLTTQ